VITREIFAELPASVRARPELGPLAYQLGLAPDGRGAYLATVGRNVRFYEHGARILDEAERRGLSMLPLKGALFAELYGDLGLRPMHDLDLVAHPRDLDAVVAMMGELGFRRRYPERARFSPRHAHDVAFADDADQTIEVHWRLFHELAGDAGVEALFERAVEVELYGHTRRVPAWDDHLWAAAVHAATHAFGDSPLWILDLALLVERGADVERAAREAERRRVGAAFRAALKVARAALPSKIPEAAARRGDRLRARLLGVVLGDALAEPPRRVPSLLARALLTDDPRDAVREVLRKLELSAVEAGEWLRAAASRGA
jgi:Uncharacterised nucleotidyltransferase